MARVALLVLVASTAACAASRLEECEQPGCSDDVVQTCQETLQTCDFLGPLASASCIDSALSLTATCTDPDDAADAREACDVPGCADEIVDGCETLYTTCAYLGGDDARRCREDAIEALEDCREAATDTRR